MNQLNKMKNSLLLLFFSCSFFCANSQESFINLSVAPKVNFTQNFDYNIGGAIDKIGIGYNVSGSYIRTFFKSKMFCELGLGYSSYRLSVVNISLVLPLGKDELSYQFDYLQSFFKIGYTQHLPLNITVQPYLGLRFLFYLPYRNYTKEDYKNVDISLIDIPDIESARYSEHLTALSFHTFIFTIGAKFQTNITNRLSLNASPFLDLGFTPLRTMIYRSDIMFEYNRDRHESSIATNKGDAFGLELGLSYRLKK